MDISMISMSPDREGDVDLQCDVCPRVWFDAPNDLHVLSLVAAAEAHVRKYHVAVIDADPVDAEADYDEKRAIYVKQQLHHNGHYGVPDHSPGAAGVLPGVTCTIPGHCTIKPNYRAPLIDGTGITGIMIDVVRGPSLPAQGRDWVGEPYPEDPCASGCSDPAAHAEGGHDV
jgi:hypothetical protein